MIPDATSNLPDMDSIQVVSWDVDGTLYSTRRAAWHAGMRALGSTIRRRRLDPLWELAELRELWRRVEQARFDAQNPVGVHENSRRRRELESRWWAPAIVASGPRPGVEALLGHFQGRVRAQVILTDYEADDKLRGLGLQKYFGAVYVGERMGFFKPNPAPFERILEDFGLDPSACSTSATGWTRTAPERRPPAVGHSSFERTFVRSGNSIRCWLAACGETLTAFDRRCIPAELRCSSVTYREYARSSRLVSRAPRRSRCDAGFHHRLLGTPDVPRPREFCCGG